MKEYRVKVYDHKTEWFNLDGKRHRENGPAVEHDNGDKFWFLNNKNLTEDEFNQRMNPTSCSGKIVEIDGKKYRLTEI